MELPTRFSSQGLSKLFTVFLLGTENAMGGNHWHSLTFACVSIRNRKGQKGKKEKRQKGKNIYNKKDKMYKKDNNKKYQQDKKKDKITHTWQGARRAHMPSAGARIKGP